MGAPVIQNFATKCPTDLAGGIPVVQIFATRCPTDIAGGPKKKKFGVTSGATSGGGGGGSQKVFFILKSLLVPLPMPLPVGGPKFFFLVSLLVTLPVGGWGVAKFFFPVSLPEPLPVGGGGPDVTLPRYPFFSIFFCFLTNIFFVFFCVLGHDQTGARAVHLLRSRRRTVLFKLLLGILNYRHFANTVKIYYTFEQGSKGAFVA